MILFPFDSQIHKANYNVHLSSLVYESKKSLLKMKENYNLILSQEVRKVQQSYMA